MTQRQATPQCRDGHRRCERYRWCCTERFRESLWIPFRKSSCAYQLNRLRRTNNTRSVEAKQLDDGIGDTLVAVRATCGVYKRARLRCRNYIVSRWRGADYGFVWRGVRFRRIGNTHVRPSSLLAPPRNK